MLAKNPPDKDRHKILAALPNERFPRITSVIARFHALILNSKRPSLPEITGRTSSSRGVRNSVSRDRLAIREG